jgi:hypothetical protein
MMAQLRYYYRSPLLDNLPEKKAIALFAELQWIREQEAKQQQ